MRLEDMKNNIPETPEFIYLMIQDEVKKQLQDTKVINIPTGRKKKWTGKKVAVAVAAGTLAASTIVYAGTNLYHMFIEKQGKYSVSIGLETNDKNGKINLPTEIHDINISAGYIPEGMEWIDEFHLQYPEHTNNGGFSFSSVLLDNDDMGKVIQDKNVVDYEKRTFGDYEGVYLKYNKLWEESYDQRIYLFCPDIYRVITIYIGSDVLKEDAVKVAENLEITESETMIETADLYTWSELVSPEEISTDEALTSIEDDKLPMHQIGNEFTISGTGEDSNGNYIDDSKISVCVDSVQIADDLELLDKNRVPEKLLDEVGADGKLKDNTLSYIKSGDGVDSVDEIVKTEDVKQKLVYATVTYTNRSDKEIAHMLYIGSLMLLNHENGIYEIYAPGEQSGDGFDRVIWNGGAKTPEMQYYSVSEDYGNGRNYISSLKPDESVQVDMAWIVNENDLDHMYLNLNGDGAAYEFSDATLKMGLVDISQ